MTMTAPAAPAAPPTSADIAEIIETTHADIERMETRRAEIAAEIAGAWDKDTGKLQGEYASLGARIAAGSQRLSQLANGQKGAQKVELLALFEQRTAESHAAYTVMAEQDAIIKEHQAGIEAALKIRANAETVKTTSAGRRAKLQQQLTELGVKGNELEAIRRKFAPIPMYW